MNYILDLRKSTDLLYQLHGYLTTLVFTLGIITTANILYNSETQGNTILILGIIIALLILLSIRTIQYKKRYRTVINIDHRIRTDGTYNTHKKMMESTDNKSLTNYYNSLIQNEKVLRNGRKNTKIPYYERVYLTLIHYEKKALLKKGVVSNEKIS